jgi:hypothetical protein
MRNEQPSPPAAGPVTDIVRDVVRELAPEELAVFEPVAERWRRGGRRPERSPGAAVGFGVEDVLLAQLAFPVVTAAVGEVLGDLSLDRLRARRRGRRPDAGPESVAAGPAAQSSHPQAAPPELAGPEAARAGGHAAADALTPQQRLDLREACLRHAVTLGMSPARAALLADAVLGSLTIVPDGE